ncbi:MAG: GAF domain-containing protein [Chloroflexota bacterium]
MSKDQYFKRLESLFSTTEPVEPEPSNGKAAVATSAELFALRARLAEAEAALAEARQQSAAAQQLESQQAETNALRERVGELGTALAEARQRSAAAQQLESQQQAETNALRERVAELEAALAEARQQSDAAQQFESQQQAETSALRERVAELEAALAQALTQSVKTVDQNTGTVGQDVAHAANEGEEVYRDGKPYATRGVLHDITQLKQADESLRRQNEYLAAFENITLGLIGRLDLTDLLENVVARAGALVGTSHGYIFLHEPGDDAMQMHVGVGAYSSLVGYRIQPGGAVVGKVWQTGQPLVIDDYQAWADRLNLTNLEPVRSIVGVPLKSGSEVVGVIGLAYVEPGHRFGEAEVEVVGRFAQLASVALDNARLYAAAQRELAERKQAEEALAKRASELAMVAQVSTAASTIQDVQHMLQTVVDTTKSSFNLYHAHVYLLNAPGDTLVLTAGAGEVGKQMVAQGRRIPVSQEQSLVARAARTRQGVIVNDVQTDSGFLPNPLLPGTRSEMAVPMIIGDQVLGVFDVQSETVGRFTSEEVSIQTTLAAQVAAALQNARSYEQAEKALRELNTLTRRLTREGWNAYLETQPSSRLSYAYDLSEIVPLDADDRAAESNGKAIERPLTLRGETIGRVTIAEAEKVDEEAQAVVTAVAEQLTAHIENLRLTEQALAAQQQSELRAVELEAIAKVSAAASTILDADTLLQTVVDLTKESLALYHAHIYLLDETGDTLILAAGAGEVGRKMAATGRSILINREHSLVARAARTRRGVIANDVGQEPDFLPNPLLPNTRSEMAVPMILGDALLGVFDVQADTINRFSAEDVRLKTTLAEQVAVALQNARLYAEQASTVERLRELDQLKSSFLANMSHELRTPLNSILGFTQVMLEGIDGDLNERMENDLAIIQNNGQHLLNLISDILDMAKIEAGKMTLNPEIFDLKEVLDEVLDITGPLARAKSLDLIVNAGSESAMDLYADRMRLRQVMINLVNNAIKFTESGYIEIAAGRPEGLFRIAVRDTGISIPVDHLETIFQEFSQVDSSTTRKTGGTGLGLPISRHLIELHGGRLWAESTGTPGEGSSFIIELPAEAPYEDGNLTPKTQPVQ